MTPPAKPPVFAQILAALAGVAGFLFGISLNPQWVGLSVSEPTDFATHIVAALPLFLPFTLTVLAYLLVHRLFSPPSRNEKSPCRIATSPAHFVWCILEPLVLGSAFLAYYLPRNSYSIPPLLNAMIAFGVLIAPLILLANALALRRKSPILAVISALTVLGALVALSLPVIT